MKENLAKNFYEIKADLFNRCCRNFEKGCVKDFSFEQLKNNMSKQSKGEYYKILINYKGVDFFNKQLKKDFDSYKKFGTLIECVKYSDEYFEKLKAHVDSEEIRILLNNNECRKNFIKRNECN